MTRTALLAGASGLVGGHLLRRLLDDARYARVFALVRRPLAVTHPKLVAIAVYFDRPGAIEVPAADDVFSSLGTTIRAAGSQAAFRRVDLDATLAVARAGLAAGAQAFLFVSALGADPASRVFYNRVKGEAERAAFALPYRTVVAVRPSLLLGARREFRLGERAAAALVGPVRSLVPVAWRPVDADDVAAAMVLLARRELDGRHVVDNADLARLARESPRAGT